MAPNVQVTEIPKYYEDDEVVISGISGRLPNCDTFEEFKEKLFNGTDILDEGESRWPDGKYIMLFSFVKAFKNIISKTKIFQIS